ncbi:MAG: sugar phosphate isomerase/epimerase [Anaerohalosphaeraceae bacterium]|nr:sugar phosphate isomerase/epimerase [Anaerohalosphaeraceae bacterium]
MQIKLGINTGFAINRFTSPQEWIPLVGEVFGIRTVQFTADLLNPSLPDAIIDSQIQTINELAERYGVEIDYTFTSAFTRVNHLAHPDPDLRQYWQEWFCRFADISARLGAEAMGSHLAILTVRDYNDPRLRTERLAEVIDGWKKIAEYASGKGLKYLTWEPMSVPREMGHTIKEARKLQLLLNEDIAIPMKLCLDVDHGDVESSNPADTDPYAWIKAFAPDIAVIHLKQTCEDKGGHWPFTNEYNKKGKVTPKKLVNAIEESGVSDVTLLLELSFKEREPFESRVVDDIKASVEYWQPFLSV